MLQDFFHEDSNTESMVEQRWPIKRQFDIWRRDPSTECFRRKWRRAYIAVTATRRLRNTADQKRRSCLKQKGERLKKFKVCSHAVRAADRFRVAAGSWEKGLTRADSRPIECSGESAKLPQLVREQDENLLEQLGNIQGIANLLRTSLADGIPNDPENIQQRKSTFGENIYLRKPAKKFVAFLWDACQDTTLIILMFCALLSLAFGLESDGLNDGWYNGVSIAFAVVLVIGVTATSDYRQSLQFQNLDREKSNIQLEVVRDGRRVSVSTVDVVVGDIVVLNIGDKVPADGLLVEGHSLCLDESSITGESELSNKGETNPFLLSGCKVADGFGTMIVTCVGSNTQWGQVMQTIGEDVDEETPLQARLRVVATLIGQIGFSVASLVFIVLIVFYFSGHTKNSDGHPKFQAGQTKANKAVNSVVSIFAIAVTIIVVAVPEGLPLAVTLTLAYSMRKMMADKALVRRLAACETMGSATALCSDKTGTLTLNRMTVVRAWVAGEMGDRALAPRGEVRRLLWEGISQNTTGSVFVGEGAGGGAEVTGSPTEKAVLWWGLEMGMDFRKERWRARAVKVESFNSEKKRAGVGVRRRKEKAKEQQQEDDGGGMLHVHWKGAPEIILDTCTHYLLPDGSPRPIDPPLRSELRDIVDGMAASSLRCIAFAYRTTAPLPSLQPLPDARLALLAIVGMKDPCRPHVARAVGVCRAAGVRIRMVTGDSLATAKAIAAECGILLPSPSGGPSRAIDGAEFRHLCDDERNARLSDIDVLARMTPSDKLLLVRTLKDMGEVVAVTGDGSNDAPALHEAHIGLSMGIQGTEVAKESSDIIILDDNFTSIVKVIMWGRSVYANIQKFIQFQLTVNVAALTINFVAAISSGNVPLSAVQLLWVNLIMDTLGALALATEPPSDHLMSLSPVGLSEPLITNTMLRNILSQAFFQIVVLLTFQFKGTHILRLNNHRHPNKVKDTFIFNTLVFCQVFNEINSRELHKLNVFTGMFKNHMFTGIIIITIILQVVIVEFLQMFASTVNLSWEHWLLCIGIASLSCPIAFVVKLIHVPSKPILKVNLTRSSWRRGQTQRLS